MEQITGWEASGPVAKAIARLRELTGTSPSFFHMREWRPKELGQLEVLPSPCCYPVPGGYEIYVGDDLPEEMALHEILHAILLEEGYPELEFDDERKRRFSRYDITFKDMLTQFVNKFHHLEIYRRMEFDYYIAMSPYQEHVATHLAKAAQSQFEEGYFSFGLGKQVQVFNVLDLVALGSPTLDCRGFYRERAGDIYETGIETWNRIQEIGLLTPEAATRAGEAILDQVIAFGERMGNAAENDLWRALTWNSLKS